MKKLITFLFIFFAPLAINMFSSHALIVNDSGDLHVSGDGLCTLREALNIVREDWASEDCQKNISGINIIEIWVPEIITSIRAGTVDTNGGDLDVIMNHSNNLLIVGKLSDKTKITTELEERIFEIFGFGENYTRNNVTFENLEIFGGSDSVGGGILNNYGNVVLEDIWVHNNEARAGGGIYNNFGNMIINKSWITSNNVNSGAGFLGYGHGGGVFNSTTTYDARASLSASMTITNSFIFKNFAPLNGGGVSNYGGRSFNGVLDADVIIRDTYIGHNVTGGLGIDDEPYGSGAGIENTRGRMTVENSIIEYNKAGRNGGALYTGGDSSNGYYNIDYRTTIDNTIIKNNTAVEGGGAIIRSGESIIEINNSEISYNTASVGGAIFNLFPEDELEYIPEKLPRIDINNSEISHNKALYFNDDYRGDGGAIHNRFNIFIDKSYIHSNYANEKGGVFYNFTPKGNIEVKNSEISNNGLKDSRNPESEKTAEGGVLYSLGGKSTITNTTMAYNYAESGSVFSNRGISTINVQYSTIAKNYIGSEHPAIRNGGYYGPGQINLFASIIALNGGRNCNTDNDINAAHTFIYKNGGGNDPSCKLASMSLNNHTDVNPKFDGDLRNNGGPTKTIALSSDSPAINHSAADSSCVSKTDGIDQRLFNRVSGQCDSGAYEFDEYQN